MRVATFLILSCLALAQQSSTTSGPCSPIAPNNTGTIRIDCQGVSAKLGSQLVEILNRIANRQLDPNAVMAKLDEILHAINPNAPKVTYSLNGSTRTISPQGVSLNLSPNPASKEIEALNAARDWPALARICERTMSETPEWYTPFVFAGIAYANLGQKDKAIDLLQRADQGMAGNTDYGMLPAEVKRLLDLLRQK
jgi:hypothetical protein